VGKSGETTFEMSRLQQPIIWGVWL